MPRGVRLLVHPDEPAGDVRPPPQLAVAFTLFPCLGGPRDAEQKVGYVCRLFISLGGDTVGGDFPADGGLEGAVVAVGTVE